MTFVFGLVFHWRGVWEAAMALGSTQALLNVCSEYTCSIERLPTIINSLEEMQSTDHLSAIKHPAEVDRGLADER